MFEETNDHEQETLTTGTTSPVTSSPPVQPSVSGDDWELRYKGLQKVQAKKDATIEKLQADLDNLATELEALRGTHQSTQSEKDRVAQLKEELESQLKQASTERDRLKISLQQNKLILDEYPDLAQLARYIPESDDDETFRANATTFRNDLERVIEARLKNVMSGSAPPQPASRNELASEDEKDALWKKVATLAGIPGKEAEYEEARQKWVALMQIKS